MTKGSSTRRSKFIKSVRAQAHKEGTSFYTALWKEEGPQVPKEVFLTFRMKYPLVSVAHRGWFSDGVLVDDGDNNIYDEDVYDFKIDFSDVQPPTHKVDTTVSLLDIARPAKKKGIAKDSEFEVIKKAPKAALLDNEEFEIWEDDLLWEDDWEKIHDEQRIDTRPSYSSVLRRNER